MLYVIKLPVTTELFQKRSAYDSFQTSLKSSYYFMHHVKKVPHISFCLFPVHTTKTRKSESPSQDGPSHHHINNIFFEHTMEHYQAYIFLLVQSCSRRLSLLVINYIDHSTHYILITCHFQMSKGVFFFCIQKEKIKKNTLNLKAHENQ